MAEPDEVAIVPAAGMDEIRAAYQVAYSRYQSNTDVLWRVIAFSLASEAALWVAIVRVKDIPTWGEALLGLGLLLLGLAGPQTVNFIESVSMMDRLLLDIYEREMGLPEKLRMLHGERFQDRYWSYMGRFVREADFKAAKSLLKRRLDKAIFAPVANQKASWPRRAQKILDLLGQPSLVWTAVIAAAGSVGFIVATGTKLPLGAEIPVDVLVALLVVLLWFTANGWLEAIWSRVMRRKPRIDERPSHASPDNAQTRAPEDGETTSP